MPAWGTVIGADAVASVAAYVQTLSGKSAAAPEAAAGKEVFATYCVACHGEDGHGMAAVGAPNLADEYWLYGGSPATIKETVTNGRSGQMPAHGTRLSPVQIKLLAAYVLSLTESASAPGN